VNCTQGSVTEHFQAFIGNPPACGKSEDSTGQRTKLGNTANYMLAPHWDYAMKRTVPLNTSQAWTTYGRKMRLELDVCVLT